MNKYYRTLLILVCTLLAGQASSAAYKLPPQTLFTNVNIFNGTDDSLYENYSVLVENNLIKAISANEIKANTDATVIDGNPLEDVKLLGATFDLWALPRKERSIDTFLFIMKDGTIYRNEI